MPDGLWELVAPLLPGFKSRPQGGGTAPVDERAVFTTVVYVLTSGCAWQMLPDSFGVSLATAHRRFTVWAEVGQWRRCTGRCWTNSGPGGGRLEQRDRGCGECAREMGAL